jgi:GTPase SAR1 family protein
MKTFYKGASAVILTYSISEEKSFEDLDYWLKQISKSLTKQRNTAKAKYS